MKKQVILFLICLVTTLTKAQLTSLSETNGGFYIAITGAQSGNNQEAVLFNRRLLWLPFCASNIGNALIEFNYPIPQYGTKVKMIGPDGKEVPKTDFGKMFGSKWDQLHRYKDSKLKGISAGCDYQSNVGAAGGQFLWSPNELFKIEKPGIYTLEIQMQMFRHTGSTDPEEEHRNLIRFSSVTIKVEKPPDLPPNAQKNSLTN